MNKIQQNSLLLVNSVPLREIDGQLGLDDQTCAGLVRWAENFERVVIAGPSLPEHIAVTKESSTAGTVWQPLTDLPCADQLEFVPLPYAYKLRDFTKVYAKTRRLLQEKIHENQYLCFVIARPIGDWGGIAALEAIKLGRPYTAWLDRVEYEVISRTLQSLPLKSRIKEFLHLPLMKRYQQYLIRQSSLGLFQGQDCYQAYSPFCKQPHCIYDVHTKKSDQIDESSINLKIESLKSNEPLLICYVGRAADMKGPFDWLHIIHRICQAGVNVKATWFGDGPLLLKMKLLTQELGIGEHVNLVGFVNDQTKILQTMRENHIFLFCHKTPESPRCLIESIVSGCPIVGYDSSYSQDLVSRYGGGAFVPMNDWQKLADLVIELNSDRSRLSKLIRAAALSGQFFDEETVYQQRSDLIQKYSGFTF
jgi:glycosyltransferase involved in cell wall biosynthesis